jgi:4-hydroxy-2-oxoheptanedioate aldolase
MIKQKMKDGKFVLGTWCVLPSASVINVIAKAGLDFVIIDMEHGPMDYKTAQEMIMAAESEGCEAIIRVPRNDESDTLRALDIGASGIIVPHIENVGDRRNAVSYSKFSPVGNRGFNPYIRAGQYHGVSHTYFEEQNKRILLCIILEGINALKNLEHIISDPEIDAVYIGTYDLSVALGVPGDVSNKKVIKALEASVIRIRDKGKSAGCMVHNVDDLKRFKEIGIQFITYKVDTAIIYESFSEMKRELEK